MKQQITLTYLGFLALYLILAIGIPNGYCGEPEQSGSMMDSLERTLELDGHNKLIVTMQAPGSSLAAFTTDGCSGGLSVGWQYLSERITRLKKVHGELPPWESCCVDHDHCYHTAGGPEITAEKSFEARREADEILRSCVQQVGAGRAPELADQYGLSREEVGHIYKIIGDLMYRSVRLGGIPCSGLPWRWGYGWPECE